MSERFKTPEERDAYNAYARERMRRKRAEMTPEERRLQMKLDREYSRQYLRRKRIEKSEQVAENGEEFVMSKEMVHPQNPFEEKLNVLALYAITIRLLSAPEGYVAPPGGLKEQLRLFSKKGAQFEPAWRALSKRYLKVARITATGQNSRYVLYTEPREDILPVDYLTADETRIYLAEHPVSFVAGADRYLPENINWSMLRDNSISLNAKGLLILLKHEQEGGRSITKQAIANYCALRHIPLLRTWSECLKSGYLKHSRAYDSDTHQLIANYTLNY